METISPKSDQRVPQNCSICPQRTPGCRVITMIASDDMSKGMDVVINHTQAAYAV